MKFFDRWLYKQVKKAWDNKDQYEDVNYAQARNMKMGMGTAIVERGHPEGQDRVSFELSSAVGGRILNVRRYDERKDSHNQQTYVIPNGEDIGERVAKIINLEMFRQ